MNYSNLTIIVFSNIFNGYVNCFFFSNNNTEQQHSWQLHKKGYYTTLLIQVLKAEQKYDWIILNCYTTCLSKDCETRLNCTKGCQAEINHGNSKKKIGMENGFDKMKWTT